MGPESARRWRSSPTRSSSSAPATARRAGNGSAPPQSDVPADTSDFEDAEPASVGAKDDDIPF